MAEATTFSVEKRSSNVMCGGFNLIYEDPPSWGDTSDIPHIAAGTTFMSKFWMAGDRKDDLATVSTRAKMTKGFQRFAQLIRP
jgi:hypothetical protein